MSEVIFIELFPYKEIQDSDLCFYFYSGELHLR